MTERQKTKEKQLNLDAVGIEIAFLCMFFGVFILFRYGNHELKRTKTGRILNRLVIASAALSVAMYVGLRLTGVNP